MFACLYKHLVCKHKHSKDVCVCVLQCICTCEKITVWALNKELFGFFFKCVSQKCLHTSGDRVRGVAITAQSPLSLIKLCVYVYM